MSVKLVLVGGRRVVEYDEQTLGARHIDGALVAVARKRILRTAELRVARGVIFADWSMRNE